MVGAHTAYVNSYLLPKIINNEIRLGFNREEGYYFNRPNGEKQKITINWHTTLKTNKSYISNYIFTAKYDKNKYQFYDEPYDNILNVDSYKDIPIDYDGLIGVPINSIKHLSDVDWQIADSNASKKFSINGKEKFKRLVIRNKKL